MFNPEGEVKAFYFRLRRKRGDRIEQFEPALRGLLWREGGKTFAHCLELDIVASGPDDATAGHALLDLIAHQIEFSEKESTQLFHSAPEECWEKFKEISLNNSRQAILNYFRKTPSRKIAEELEFVS